MTDNLSDTVKKTMISLFAFLLASGLTFGLLFSGSLDTFPLVKWVKESQSPSLGLLAISLLFSSLLWLIIRFGKITEIKPGLINSKISLGYVFKQIPPVFLALIALSSLVILVFARPICSPPNFQFEVQSGEGKKLVSQQGSLELTGGAVVIVKITADLPVENLSCDWKTSGDIFQYIPITSYCQNTVYMNNKLGDGILNIGVKNKYCPGTTLANLLFKIK